MTSEQEKNYITPEPEVSDSKPKFIIKKLLDSKIGKWAAGAGAVGGVALILGGLYLSKRKNSPERQKLRKAAGEMSNHKNEVSALIEGSNVIKGLGTAKEAIDLIDEALESKDVSNFEDTLLALKAFINESPRKNK